MLRLYRRTRFQRRTERTLKSWTSKRKSSRPKRRLQLLQKSPVPKERRGGAAAVVATSSISSSPPTGAEPSPRKSSTPALQKSPVTKKFSSAGMTRASGRRKSGELTREEVDKLEIEVNSVVMPSTPNLASPQQRRVLQARRLSRVNPRDVKRLYEGPTFGVPLAHLMYIGYDEFVIPPILAKTTTFLLGHADLEGLFRVSGSQDEISDWKVRFNAGEPVQFGEKTSPHSVAGLLKAWLRELPEPLLTFQMFDVWMHVATKTILRTPDKAVPSVKKKLAQLPIINVAVLAELFRFLKRIADQSAKNLMTAENVGVVIGPNILSKENQDALTSAMVMPAGISLAAYFVKNAEQLFSDDGGVLP